MKKLSMKTSKKITFYDGCEMYIQNCRQLQGTRHKN